MRKSLAYLFVDAYTQGRPGHCTFTDALLSISLLFTHTPWSYSGVNHNAGLICTGDAVFIRGGDEHNFIGKVLGFYQNLTDNQQCAEIEWLYWPDEVREQVRGRGKKPRVGVRIPETLKKEAFSSKKTGQVEVSTILCKAELLHLSTSAPYPKKLKKEQVVTRWHFDAERKEFSELVINDDSCTEPPKAIEKFPPSRARSVLTEGSNRMRQKQSITSLQKAQSSDLESENSEPRTRKASLLLGKHCSPTISLPHSPNMRFYNVLPRVVTPIRTTSKLTTSFLEEDPLASLERTPEVKASTAASKSKASACKRRLYGDIDQIHSQLFDNSDTESIGDDECEPSGGLPSRHTNKPPSDTRTNGKVSAAAISRKRKRSIAPATGFDQSVQSTSKAKKHRLTNPKGSLPPVTGRTKQKPALKPCKGSGADDDVDLSDEEVYHPEPSESESELSHEESDVESEVESEAEALPKTPKRRSRKLKVTSSSRPAKRPPPDTPAPKRSKATSKAQKTPARRTNGGSCRRKEHMPHLPQRKEVTKPAGESNPFEIAKER